MENKRGLDWTYFFILLFTIFFQRLDTLVCPAIDYSWGLLTSYWVFASALFVLFGLSLYAVCKIIGNSKQGVWYFILTNAMWFGGFVDLFYMLQIPIPDFWINPKFVWYWNMYYQVTGYPWTIKEQLVLWVIVIISLAITYKYLRKRYNIYGLVK